MKRLCTLTFTVGVIALATARPSVGDPPLASPAAELDPQEVFQAACDRLKGLEAKHDALKGVSEIKPRRELHDDKRLQSASFVFEDNAVPPGKKPATARDEAKPFVYVSLQVWSGRSQQPPAGLRPFQWKGEKYEAWVQVYGSDPALVRAIRKAVDEPILAPPAKKQDDQAPHFAEAHQPRSQSLRLPKT